MNAVAFVVFNVVNSKKKFGSQNQKVGLIHDLFLELSPCAASPTPKMQLESY